MVTYEQAKVRSKRAIVGETFTCTVCGKEHQLTSLAATRGDDQYCTECEEDTGNYIEVK